ncbi:Gfo/Idh/MocA family oxidoreductase [Bacillus sp. B15-48]|uniref:Gfo/Idh/MocA family protein n=1 Tax=Bacillus sp. B15-48 TaxID=1548601 RepID=UPI00193F89C3|nr:Gfo/Idh/MocA family oxidoreductase [Bacillus sp. B15-48]MBM4761145.1 oxidoreductase [Bacillus sp. B15-48]
MVRFGIVGTNWITEAFITSAKKLADFSLVAVYSRTEERANEFADQFNIPHRFTELEAMAKSNEIDAIYIASPNSFHAEQAVLCMKHGKHVLCEKPMASNSREVQKMIEVAKENNVLLMEALKTTLMPNFHSIQEHIGKLGRIRRYVGSYCQYSSRYDAYLNGKVLNAFKPQFSNGALMDLGIYCLYPLVVLFGKPLQVKANAVLLDSGVDGEGSLLMQYEDKEAVVYYSKITHSHLPAEIQGEKGNMIIDKISEPGKVEIHYRDGSIEDITYSQEHMPMYYEAKEFIDLIQKHEFESSINSHQHSLIVAEIMEEARKQTGIIYPAD